MKKFLSILLILFVLCLSACANAGKSDAIDSGASYAPRRDGGSGLGDGGLTGLDGMVSKSEGYPGAEGMPYDGGDGEEIDDYYENQEQIKAGQLTASATFDNDKYAFWQSLLTSNQEGNGIFEGYNNNYAFKTANRITLTFPKGTYARVTLKNEDKDEFVGVSDANGVCYVFAKEKRESYSLDISYINKDGDLTSFEDSVTGDKEYDLEAQEVSKDLIEIMFVIDATGSMGDEISYLQAEISDVIKKVKEANNNIRILISIMVYRDEGDQYVTKYNDFSESVEDQLAFLNKQSAGGGGDIPEAVEVAFEEACEKQWTTGTSTKILVHVADAPSHDKDVASWANSVNKLASMGVRILTVASSGIDKATEYLFRCQSLLTNGVYVHLTNDSGIGGDHIEATTEETEVVELLNDCLVRVINGFHTGNFGEAINWHQSQSTPAE